MGMPMAQAQFLPRTITLGISGRSRHEIEQEIEFLIGLLDHVDGDADLEPDHEDYDACDLGEPDMCMKMPPRYGINQSRGPTNRNEAWAEHYVAQCQRDDEPAHLLESEEYAQV